MLIIYICTLIIAVIVLGALMYAAYLFKRAKDLAPYYAEKEALVQDIQTAKQTQSQLRQEWNDLQSQIAQAKMDIADGKMWKDWLDNNQNTVSSLQSQIDKAQRELDDVNDTLNTIRGEKQQREGELRNVLAEIDSVTGKKDEAQRDLDRVQSDLNVERNRYNTLEASNVKQEEKLNKLLQSCARQEVEKSELESRRTALLGTMEENEKELEKLKESIQEQQIVQGQLSNAIDLLQRQKGEKEKELGQVANKMSDLNREYNELTKQVTQLREEKSGLDGKKTALLGTIEENEKELDKLKESIQKQQIVQGQLSNAIDLLQRQRGEKEKELNQVTNDNKKLKDKRNGLVTEVSMMEQNLAKIRVEEGDEKQQWQDLDREIKTINITNPKPYKEDEWLNEFEQNLKDCHFRFDTRLIRAFHTSLKVADCSPMVVLSGISGTGKSLLPELYAHAVGMNFLQVPVQPRWDSPQDMLGFYNYMEHRYKATELARLLWQTDQYNNKEQAKKNPAMNMILLDEMNLARVEYYFSDMLSKLEVRRGIDPKNTEKRKAAEIVLESGAMGKNNRRIFIGSHNLFVGTMNEDESTQSLSDKVKDRANVLRFGKPKELNGAMADKNAFFEKYKDRMMTEASWKEWRKTSSALGNINLGQIMDNLNKHLANLGRPFAHRMWNAVDSYIKQYPGDAKNALTDQIEMKILPKLNGLDMTDQKTRDEMVALKAELASSVDQDLVNAFEEAFQQEFFIWNGIQR